MRRLSSIATALLLMLGQANAATEIAGVSVNSNNLSGTIAVTNTFQSIQIATERRGCTVQNQGSNANAQWVFFGPIASATKAKSVYLEPGRSVGCRAGVAGLLNDQISITGTAGDAFFAAVQ